MQHGESEATASEPMKLGTMTSAEDFRQLAAQKAALARAAVTNESRAQYYAMAAYYTRLAEAKEKIAKNMEVGATPADHCSEAPNPASR
jgi:hypothetical protein